MLGGAALLAVSAAGGLSSAVLRGRDGSCKWWQLCISREKYKSISVCSQMHSHNLYLRQCVEYKIFVVSRVTKICSGNSGEDVYIFGF